jgi:hypothetical protein
MLTQINKAKQNNSFFKFLKDGYSIMRDEPKNSKAIICLALLYFFELASYLTFTICVNGEWNLPIALFSGTMIGGICFSYIIAMQKMTVQRVLKLSNYVYLLGTIFHCLLWILHKENKIEKQVFDTLRTLSYFVFGFGFAPTIGLIVSQITEKLPRYNRSFNLGLVHGIGFLSPVVIALIFGIVKEYYNPKDCPEISILFAASIFGLLASRLTKNIPEDAAYTTRESVPLKTWLSWYGLSNNAEQNSNYGRARTFYMSVLTGFNMIFFFYLFTNIRKIIFVDESVTNYHTIFFSYLGLSLGTFFWSWMSKKTGSRRKVIIWSNGMQFFVLIVMASMYYSGTKFTIYQFWPIIFMLGISCNWAITLAQSSEQFISTNRASQMALLPNFFRFAPLFLTFATQIDDHNDVLKTYATLFILILAFIFLLISCVAALSFKDKFGIEALTIDNEDKSIVSSELRKQINDIKAENDKVQYFKEANKLIAKHFKAKMKGLYYLNSIYHRNADQSEVISPLLDENLINRQALEERGAETDLDKIAFLHSIGDELIREKHLESTSLWIAQSDHISGMLIWNPGRTQMLRPFEDPNSGRRTDDKTYSVVINLQEMVFEKGMELLPKEFKDPAWASDFMKNKRLENEHKKNVDKKSSTHSDIWLNHILKLSENVTFIGDLAILLQKLALEKYKFEFDVEKLKLSLIHFRIDAELYQRGSYYRYCIKPYSRTPETITLMSLKTVTALPKKRLGQLRDLMTTLMLEKANFIINKKNKELLETNYTVAFEEEHYKKNEFFIMKRRLMALAEKNPEISDNPNFGYIREGIEHLLNVSSFFVTMMKKKPYTTDSLAVNVKQVINSKLNTVLNTLDSLELDKNHLDAIDLNRHAFFNVCENISESIHVQFNPVAFHIIVMELIKNGIKHSSLPKPYFTIQWLQDEDFYVLEFKNNGKINNSDLEYMNGKTEILTQKNKISGGLRSVRRILSYYEHTGWQMNAKRNSDESKIVVSIRIPKESVVFPPSNTVRNIIQF